MQKARYDKVEKASAALQLLPPAACHQVIMSAADSAAKLIPSGLKRFPLGHMTDVMSNSASSSVLGSVQVIALLINTPQMIAGCWSNGDMQKILTQLPGIWHKVRAALVMESFVSFVWIVSGKGFWFEIW